MKFLAALCLTLTLTGCMPTENPVLNEPVPYGDLATDEPVGLSEGVWHGFVIVFSMICSIVDEKVNIYETHNNGTPYNFGFLIGISLFLWAFDRQT